MKEAFFASCFLVPPIGTLKKPYRPTDRYYFPPNQGILEKNNMKTYVESSWSNGDIYVTVYCVWQIWKSPFLHI